MYLFKYNGTLCWINFSKASSGCQLHFTAFKYVSPSADVDQTGSTCATASLSFIDCITHHGCQLACDNKHLESLHINAYVSFVKPSINLHIYYLQFGDNLLLVLKCQSVNVDLQWTVVLSSLGLIKGCNVKRATVNV